jgi:hypothetical protein
MDLAGKVRFIEELIEHVGRGLIRNVEKYPDEWDGLELRRLIAERFGAADFGTMNRRRTRAFQKECLVRGLRCTRKR